QPRTAIAEILRAHASAAMDVSDGLAGDLAKLCRASGVAAEITVARVPLSDGARAALAKEPALIETVLTGGVGYERVASRPARQTQTSGPAGPRAGVRGSASCAATGGAGARASSLTVGPPPCGRTASCAQPFLSMQGRDRGHVGLWQQSGWRARQRSHPAFRCYNDEGKGKGTSCRTRLLWSGRPRATTRRPTIRASSSCIGAFPPSP